MEQPTFDVTVSREYAADPGTVFAACVDLQDAARWLFATETGTMVRVEMDARVGGEFAVVERREGEDVACLTQRPNHGCPLARAHRPQPRGLGHHRLNGCAGCGR